MKRNIRFISLALTIPMALSMITGCSSSNGGEVSEETASIAGEDGVFTIAYAPNDQQLKVRMHVKVLRMTLAHT